MIRIQAETIDYTALTEAVRSPQSGAVCLFLGTVREMTDGKQTAALTYEAHVTLAAKLMAQVEGETRSRWPVQEIMLVHRTGHLGLGEISVAVAISCPHRHQAFDACRYAIDRLKEIVPIWKKEHWATGGTEWVHPDS
jgi:molybdopterin synthase catalytic subunit